MAKKRRRPNEVSALQGIWERAAEEYDELEANSEDGPAMNDPKVRFCLGYVFGCGFGLALSTVRPDLVATFAPIYRKRGWLAQQTLNGNGHAGD